MSASPYIHVLALLLNRRRLVAVVMSSSLDDNAVSSDPELAPPRRRRRIRPFAQGGGRARGLGGHREEGLPWKRRCVPRGCRWAGWRGAEPSASRVRGGYLVRPPFRERVGLAHEGDGLFGRLVYYAGTKAHMLPALVTLGRTLDIVGCWLRDFDSSRAPRLVAACFGIGAP